MYKLTSVLKKEVASDFPIPPPFRMISFKFLKTRPLYNIYIYRSEDVIFLVLLISWMGVCDDDGYQVIEFFAGVARIAKLAKASGWKAVAYDRDFGTVSKLRSKRSPMDLNSNAGLAFPDDNAYELLFIFSYLKHPFPFSLPAWEFHLRLAIGLVLRSEFAALVAFFAVCCSSFVPINRGTGDRSILTPEGNEQIPSVRRSNKLMSRPGGLTFKFPTLSCCHGISN